MKKLVVGILILASFGLAACGNSNNTSQADTKKSSTQAETALTIKDSNGDQIEVPKNPEKVVVFDNGSLDTMDALGVGDKVVGAATSSLPEYLSSYKSGISRWDQRTRLRKNQSASAKPDHHFWPAKRFSKRSKSNCSDHFPFFRCEKSMGIFPAKCHCFRGDLW